MVGEWRGETRIGLVRIGKGGNASRQDVVAMLLIKGGKVIVRDSIVEADVLIGDDGKIETLGREMKASKSETINAKGMFVLPGMIDAHVHFRDPEDTTKEDFSTGTASALCGGVTTIIDMPNYRNPPTTTQEAYDAKRKLAGEKARCDWQVRFGASERNEAEAASSGSPSLKIFMTDTKSELGCSKDAIVRHFQSFPPFKPVCVHAEDRELIEERQKHYHAHEKIRDKIVSQMACEFVLREAGRLDRRVHICHLTTGLEVELCRRYPKATYEITPNHLFLSAADLKNLGKFGNINPPLRDKREVATLWRSIGEDTIIASDHAPHLISHKLEGASGYPGVGTLLPLMLSAVHEKRLTIQQVVRMCSFNPAQAFGLTSKGEISAGADGDIVLVDMKKKWKITAQNRLGKCGWTPFEGKEICGSVEKVVLRGKLAYENDGEGGGPVLSKPGEGKEAASNFVNI